MVESHKIKLNVGQCEELKAAVESGNLAEWIAENDWTAVEEFLESLLSYRENEAKE